MTRYAALLRGVNVGGINIKMADLAELFGGLGFSSVKTVLASGNVLFESDGTAEELRGGIETALREKFGYQAQVHVVALDALRAIVDGYPLQPREGWHRYVVFFLDGAPSSSLAALCDGSESEAAAVGDGVLYWTVERGHTLDTPFAKSLGSREFGSRTTNRNLNTLEKLLR
jgi:uncharacterized protein (DUF1697 family)